MKKGKEEEGKSCKKKKIATLAKRKIHPPSSLFTTWGALSRIIMFGGG